MTFRTHPCGDAAPHERHWVHIGHGSITYAGYECAGIRPIETKEPPVTADQLWPDEAEDAVYDTIASATDGWVADRSLARSVLAALSVHAVPRAHMENLKHHTRVAFDAGMAENAALRADLVALQQAALDLAASFRGSGRMGEGDGYADELVEVVTRWLDRLGGVFPREMVDELRAAMNGTATKTGEDEPHA